MPKLSGKGKRIKRFLKRAAIGAGIFTAATVVSPKGSSAQLANPAGEPPKPTFKTDVLRIGTVRVSRPSKGILPELGFNREVFVSFPLKKTGTHVQTGLQLNTPNKKVKFVGPYGILSQYFNIGKVQANVGGRARINLPMLGIKVGKQKFSTQFGTLVSYEKAKIWADAFGDAVRVYRYGAGYRVLPANELFTEYHTSKGLRVGVSFDKFAKIFGTSLSAQALTHSRDVKGATLALFASHGGIGGFAKIDRVPGTGAYQSAVALTINPESIFSGRPRKPSGAAGSRKD